MVSKVYIKLGHIIKLSLSCFRFNITHPVWVRGFNETIKEEQNMAFQNLYGVEPNIFIDVFT